MREKKVYNLSTSQENLNNCLKTLKMLAIQILMYMETQFKKKKVFFKAMFKMLHTIEFLFAQRMIC